MVELLGATVLFMLILVGTFGLFLLILLFFFEALRYTVRLIRSKYREGKI
jgi:hypothetical protein